jgi:hypothetical protein
MINISVFERAGEFAENKDIAKDLRINIILPALEKGESIVLDFSRVGSTTQSFIHALISDLIRIYGDEVLDNLSFKNCSDTVKKIISIVVDYMQQSRS